jgi:hypothetical protein
MKKSKKQLNKNLKKLKKYTRRLRNKKGGGDLIKNYNSMTLKEAIEHFNMLLREKCQKIMNNRQLYITIEDDSEEFKKLCLNIMTKNEPIDESIQMITRTKRRRPEYEYIHECISSIELTLDSEENGIVIDSKTLDEFQKRNLNTLLRSLIILLGRKIDPEKKYIVSYPMNYLSAYSLITKFNGIPYNAETNKKINISKLNSVQDYQNYYLNTPKPEDVFEEDYIGPIDEIRVDLNYYNLNTAYDIFLQTLSKISCDILEL